MTSDREKLTAAEKFVESWADSELAATLIRDYDCYLGCEEAETFAGLFRAFGHPGIADAIIEDHSEHDEPESDHYTESESN